MDEFFDEARRCKQCHVVTYCDRCPLCGSILPRSKSRRRSQVAGEEMVEQPRHTGMHRELLHKQRAVDHGIEGNPSAKPIKHVNYSKRSISKRQALDEPGRLDHQSNKRMHTASARSKNYINTFAKANISQGAIPIENVKMAICIFVVMVIWITIFLLLLFSD